MIWIEIGRVNCSMKNQFETIHLDAKDPKGQRGCAGGVPMGDEGITGRAIRRPQGLRLLEQLYHLLENNAS